MKIKSAEFVKSSTTLNNCPGQGYPEIALAGRSNVGKSSFLNKLVNRKKLARISKTPGRTQTINFYLINGSFYLVDLPGYGYAKVPEKIKAQWGPMIEKYLTGRQQLRGIILLVDIRHEPTDQDLQLCDFFRYYGFNYAVVATKSDKISRGKMLKHLNTVTDKLELNDEDILIPYSAETGTGKEEVLEVMHRWLSY